MVGRYAFCEPSWASTSSREHIRLVVGPLKTGGGVNTPTLCGTDLHGGWDLPTEVTADRVQRGMTAECNPTCRDCATAWATAARTDLTATTTEERTDETRK